MDFFLKHQQLILRTIGGLFLLVGFVVQFWVVAQPKATQNDLASANLARMEASISGSSKITQNKSNSSKFLNELKKKQKKQLEYVTYFIMLLGVLSLGSSFLKKKEES
ncbi:MAG: hypothetical protein U9N39_04115 [Campylobacterota bacterium]|nr:hypothetical protein [Campylobacterota bacterium]